MTEAAHNLIYLAGCALNGAVPDRDRLAGMDLAALYREAARHMMTAVTALALESAGLRDPAFTEAKGKAIRKNAALDEAWEEIRARFESAGIWYMPLKGTVLQELYPKYGMRQMSDHDILIDPERAADAREIMAELGFSTERFGESNHDIYHKEPIYNFELHTGLFHQGNLPELYAYYQDVKTRLVKDADNAFGWHFTDEDFYLYMLAHEYKHFQNSGAGFRFLMDLYVFLRGKPELDRAYIDGELKKLGIGAFEEQQRRSALALFSGDSLGEEDRAALEYMSASGIYGTKQLAFENYMNRSVRDLGGGKKGKRRFILRRLFLPASVLRKAYPTLDRYPWLIPFYSVWRLVHGALFRRKTIRRRIRSPGSAAADFLRYVDRLTARWLTSKISLGANIKKNVIS